MKTRRRFTAEFKAKVALEAIRGERTISELATKHQLHPNQITQWKRQAIENLAKAFDDKASDAQVGREAEVTKLHAKIGQLVVERGFFGQSLRSLSLDRRRMMIDPDHERLSIRRQCELVSISRASFYRQPAGESPENLELMRVIDGAFMETPWYGSRQMARHLRRQGWCVGRKRVRRLMRKIGLSPIYQAPRTSEPHPQHRIYPYLLRNLAIERPDQVWCADVTYIPMRRGFLYLVAIMDWFSRKVLAWRLSNTMDADFCVAALEEAIAHHGRPDIFNTDQGSQFTSFAFTTTLKDAGIRISMDGRGRWMDNVFIERLWRSLKYECVFLNAFETGSEARNGIGSWIAYYNERRPHSTFGGRTPDEVYATAEMTERLAA
ncbi:MULTISPECIES: IS3 family transposase [Paracoccus]|uniref:IS3 family transposase n=23 Tax=Paracoccaceae TaxID=31989 RepID=A0A7H9BWP3_PARPN|nr:IS3 family transposase [Paracoccus pantotrophus]RDD72684.1 IS3 family transposase [Paracoccus versutus]RQP08638.1 MAG: IS3 family transposase [Microbacteriaceae bacterium]QLH14854.1 IS3 family transposase [Paracoccus pantotrophus]QLH15309.1 IS3 family transposase [Paracoccus pantotrophus]